jgi:gamma-glutamyltranspeptidase
MLPIVVLTDDGSLAHLTGSPCSSHVIGYTAQSLVSMLDFGLDPQEAANAPHHQNRNSNMENEAPQPGITNGCHHNALFAALTARGHCVQPRNEETRSGLSVLQLLADGFLSGVLHVSIDTTRSSTLLKFYKYILFWTCWRSTTRYSSRVPHAFPPEDYPHASSSSGSLLPQDQQ